MHKIPVVQYPSYNQCLISNKYILCVHFVLADGDNHNSFIYLSLQGCSLLIVKSTYYGVNSF